MNTGICVKKCAKKGLAVQKVSKNIELGAVHKMLSENVKSVTTFILLTFQIIVHPLYVSIAMRYRCPNDLSHHALSNMYST